MNYGCLCIMFMSVAIASSSVSAAADDGTELPPETDGRWRILLQQQLKAEKSCDLLEVLTYNEMRLGDEIAIEARISCVDGREFDASRKRQHQKFELEICQPTVC
jgi:hypothetical protein